MFTQAPVTRYPDVGPGLFLDDLDRRPVEHAGLHPYDTRSAPAAVAEAKSTRARGGIWQRFKGAAQWRRPHLPLGAGQDAARSARTLPRRSGKVVVRSFFPRSA